MHRTFSSKVPEPDKLFDGNSIPFIVPLIPTDIPNQRRSGDVDFHFFPWLFQIEPAVESKNSLRIRLLLSVLRKTTAWRNKTTKQTYWIFNDAPGISFSDIWWFSLLAFDLFIPSFTRTFSADKSSNINYRTIICKRILKTWGTYNSMIGSRFPSWCSTMVLGFCFPSWFDDEPDGGSCDWLSPLQFLVSWPSFPQSL